MSVFGITIHDPDVALTDLALAVLAGILAWQLKRSQSPGTILLLALASAALWGAVYHGFFPQGQSTAVGYLVWRLVALSIVVVAARLLSLAVPPRTHPAVVPAYAIAFALVVLFIDSSFRTIVFFYGPVVVLGLVVALRRGWTLLAAGLAASLVAAVLQVAGVSLHPVYFDHNALYHVVQAGALLLLFYGLRNAPGK